MPRHPLLPRFTWATPVTPPPISIHPKKIQALIKKLRTPQQVQRWINTLKYNPRDTMRSLHRTHHHHEAHCLEAALAAATILEYHGYPPMILDIQSADRLDHTLFLHHSHGLYGTVGISRDIGLAGRKPVYKTVFALIQSYAAPFIDARARITGYGVLDLRTLSQQHWRTNKKNNWYVERELDKVPHRKFRSSPFFIKYWRRRFLEFKKTHRNKQPDFYPHQENWC